MKRPTDYPTPTLVLGALVLLVVVGLVVASSTSSASFGAYNGAWDGTSKLRGIATDRGAEPLVAHDTAAYSRVSPNETVAVILSPEGNYSATDQSRLRRFVRQGGTLLVAGDYGPETNRLLSALGTEARLDGRPIRDDRRRYRSPVMPVAGNVSNHSLVANVSSLTLNYGTAVVPNNATVLVSTSEFAYLDANRNRQLDDNEAISSLPVATVERFGDGRVLVVGDSSAMINSMLDRPGNREFVRAVIADNRTVLLDYSHTSRLPPLALAVLVLRESPLLQLLVGGGCLALVFAWAQRPEPVRRLWSSARSRLDERTSRLTGERATERSPVEPPKMSEAAMIAYLRDRHPDWDSERIRRVVATHRDERSN
ncbi:hypothetical protein ZOD2009_14801 [Haladaptatus paucihalophilus DX253]|uniref:DUF4350 domain-containing protein n=1 Tax=Haladaptatus paucihalophilus DX253 TaxID=797209 RepID=E7QVX2_HALPU|nr:DUF4350 domain-containing protein [Haladaptatus paucihalophilus]EFW91385.1 hypothetical protein ZOD2009_14801 [Haladaptatus paucihalophilus DX253]SHK99468.1 hypothetical protein SAMN05444342_2677 [Haladaptatus paucihalophilus DX253]